MSCSSILPFTILYHILFKFRQNDKVKDNLTTMICTEMIFTSFESSEDNNKDISIQPVLDLECGTVALRQEMLHLFSIIVASYATLL